MADCPFNPGSETIADFIYRYGSRQLDLEDTSQFPCIDVVSSDYAIIHLPLEAAAPISLQRYPCIIKYGRRGTCRNCRYRY